MKAICIMCLFFAFGVTAALAADPTGTWKWSTSSPNGEIPTTLKLQSKDGKLEGDNITFWITIDYQGSPLKLVYKGKVAGDEIKFDFGTEDGSWGTQFTAKKA